MYKRLGLISPRMFEERGGMEAIWIFKRKFDCNLRVAIQNGIHAGPVETVTTWHDGAVPLPQLRSTMFGGIVLKRLQHGMTELCHHHSSAVPCLVGLALALALALILALALAL